MGPHFRKKSFFFIQSSPCWVNCMILPIVSRVNMLIIAYFIA
jgi:hypothetical protein